MDSTEERKLAERKTVADDAFEAEHFIEKPDVNVKTGESTQYNKRELLSQLFLLTLLLPVTFIGYYGLEALQSSINPDGGLGSTALSLLCILIGISSALGSVAVRVVTPKGMLLLGGSGCFLYIAVNFHPTYPSLAVGAVWMGLTAGAQCVAAAIVLVHICQQYAMVTRTPFNQVMNVMNGIFQFVFACSKPLALSISAAVFHNIVHQENTNLWTDNGYNSSNGYYGYNSHNGYNYSINASSLSAIGNNSHKDFSVCGANFCPYIDQHVDVLLTPDPMLVYILMACYAVTTGIGFIMTFFLNNVPYKTSQSCLQELMVLCCLHCNPRVLILILPFMSLGMIESMLSSSFYPSFVSCYLGLGRLSAVVICEGCCLAIAALLSGFLSKIIARQQQIIFGFIVNIVVGLLWLIMSPSQECFLFLMASLQGASIGMLCCRCAVPFSDFTIQLTRQLISF